MAVILTRGKLVKASCRIYYGDVIMSAMASQITGVSIVYSSVSSGADQRNVKAPRHWSMWWEFTAQRASNAENVSIWWRHHCPNHYLIQCWLSVTHGTSFQCWIKKQMFCNEKQLVKIKAVLSCISSWCSGTSLLTEISRGYEKFESFDFCDNVH